MTDKMTMTSSRPYMIRALYEWIVDNEFTPHIVVNASATGTEVPQQYVNKEGQIILNVAPRAVEGLELGNKAVAFSARFGGIPTNIYVPCYAVMGIYARENGQGMMFDNEVAPDPEPTPTGPIDVTDKNTDGKPNKGKDSSAKRPSLRVVK